MPAWTHDQFGRLLRSKSIVGEKIETRFIENHGYPMCTLLPSCIKFPVTMGNNYKLKPQNNSIL